MKRFFLLLCTVCALAACDEDKDYGTPTEEYNGTLTVTRLNDPTQVHRYTDKRFSLSRDEGNTLTLWMIETQFVPQMPAMTMEVPGIAYARRDNGMTLSAESVIPRMGGTPYERYEITNLTGQLSDLETQDKLDVQFDCMGYHVAYSGTEAD